jgi:hypothetical protein
MNPNTALFRWSFGELTEVVTSLAKCAAICGFTDSTATNIRSKISALIIHFLLYNKSLFPLLDLSLQRHTAWFILGRFCSLLPLGELGMIPHVPCVEVALP